MSESEVAAWADRFWRLAGRIEPFPRSLEVTVAWALPLAVVRLPQLGLGEVMSWLIQREIHFQCSASSRQLRACLIASAGRGIVFLDGSDPDDERRFSLAHEIVHFLEDYVRPREKALAKLGESVRDVLDGRRSLTPEERLGGVLRGVEMGTYLHLFDRASSGDVARIEILEAEDRADRYALELLAPRATVLSLLRKERLDWAESSTVHRAQTVLREEFGLPASIAARYGQVIVMAQRPAKSFREWLGL